MGIKESYPVIKGKSVSLKTKEQKQFFNRIHTILKKDYMSNTYSDYNLIQSLETKSFINGTKKPNKRDILYKPIEVFYSTSEQIMKEVYFNTLDSFKYLNMENTYEEI